MVSIFDKVVEDTVIRLLSDATPEGCRRDIETNNSLFASTTEEEWENYRNTIALIPGTDVNYQKVLNILNKHRPDLLEAICSTPGGVDWLEQQVESARGKLGLTS